MPRKVLKKTPISQGGETGIGAIGADLEASNKVAFLASVLVNMNQEILRPYSAALRSVFEPLQQFLCCLAHPF